LPDLLFEELTLVGRQVETAGGPLDLLGVDEEGQLVVFELNRGTLTRDAVAQVIDYASYLAELSPPALSEFITRASGKNGIAPIESQGNESRLTSRLPENLQQVLRVPGGALSPSFDGSVIGDLAHQIEGEVADHSHVFGAMAGAQSR